MRKAFTATVRLLLVGVFARTACADNTWEFSVQVSALVQTSPPRILLTWPQDSYITPSSYTIFRKDLGATSWGVGTTLPRSATNYLDSNVVAGKGYEYQITKTTSQYTGYGYIYSGINIPLTENRGRLLLVVDNTFITSLSNELALLQHDVIGDGWTVTRLIVSRDETVVSVKN